MKTEKKKTSDVLHSVVNLWIYLGKKRRLQFFYLFILTIISVFAEVISIGAVVPFLSALTSPETLMELTWFQPIVEFLDIQHSSELLFPLTIGFIGAAIFAASIRILLLWTNTRLSASMGIQLRNDVYTRALYQPYEFHISHNSSHLISIVTEKIAVAIGAGILHVLMFVSALVMSLSIIGTLIMIDQMVAFMAFSVLGGGYAIMGYLVRKKVRMNGNIIAQTQPELVKYMQEGLGGIRDIIIDNSQKVFIQSYYNTAEKLQLAGMRNSFLSNLPKSLLEMLSIILIAIFAYYLQKEDQTALPILGALALGSQRLLPALQQVYFSWSTINGSQAILKDVLSYLSKDNLSESQKEKIIKPLNFNEHIVLKNMSFRYAGTDIDILKKINLDIAKGSKVGFIGATGSGKSTLLDIIMGLLIPSEGKLHIDNTIVSGDNRRNWQANIAHVPQSIFLSDASMAENIAFGVSMDDIDFVRVKKAADQANIAHFIEGLSNGYKTPVGERGIQLSGGQRQRIGIARALYKQANIIIFDEATSALDNETELNVMQAIDSLKDELTVLIIAHRLSTLKGCDIIYRLEKGNIVESGSYEKMVQGNTHE